MKESLRKYINLGISRHRMNFKCFQDPAYHLKTLPYLLSHPDFQIVDLFVPTKKGIMENEIELILASGKEVIYNGAFMFQNAVLNPHSLLGEEREEALRVLKVQADTAIKVNASRFVVISNSDPGKR
jgi:hypothetical protein